MLSNSINHCLDLIIEGIDTGNVSLILEANEEFKSGFDKLKKSIDKIATIVSAAGLQQLEAPYNDLKNRIKAAENEMDKVPDTYSFGSQEDLANANVDSPEAEIASISIDHNSNVDALQMAILGIANFLEGFGGVFSIGKNGIVVQPKFQALVSTTNPLRVRDFIGSAEKILGAISGINGMEALKNHFKPFWDPDGTGDEEAWKSFLKMFEGQEENAAKAHQSIVKDLEDVRKDSDLEKKAPKKGVLGSLFGNIFGSEGSKDSNYDAKLIIGSNVQQEGTLFDLSFEKLQNLIVGLLENREEADAAGAAALAGIQSNQEEVQQPSKKQTQRAQQFQQITNGNVEQSLNIGAALEDAAGGPEELENANIEDLDGAKVRSSLKDADFNEEQIDYTLEELDIEDTGETPGGDSILDNADSSGDSPLDVIAQIDDLEDDEKEEWIDLAIDMDLMDGEGLAEEDNEEEEVQDVVDTLDGQIDDEEASDLVASLLPLDDDLQDEVDEVEKYQKIADEILDLSDNPPENAKEFEKKIDKVKQVEDKKEETFEQISTLTNTEKFVYQDKILDKWREWRRERDIPSRSWLYDMEGHPNPKQTYGDEYKKYFGDSSKYWEIHDDLHGAYQRMENIVNTFWGKLNSESDFNRMIDEFKGEIANFNKAEERMKQWWNSTKESTDETNESRLYSRWGRIAGIING